MRSIPRLGLYTTLIVSTILLSGLSVFAQAMAQGAIASRDHETSAVVETGSLVLNDPLAQVSQQPPREEINTFLDSPYTFWDAVVLARYWDQPLEDSKARIGRKIRFGPADISLLEQFLLDARISALGEVETLELYLQSDYSYDDAATLAAFWGDPSPYDTKLRIERNLIMGHESLIDQALELAPRD